MDGMVDTLEKTPQLDIGNPMSIRILSLAALFCAVLCLSSCASRRSVDLSPEIRETKGLTIGVALGRVCEPEMMIEGLPAGGMGPTGPSPNAFGRRDERYWGSRHPIVLADRRKLEGYLQRGDTGIFREIQNRIAQELSSEGFNAVAIEYRVDRDELPPFEGPGEGYAEQDYRKVALGENLDALLVVDCRRYGVYCHYTGYYHQDFTDAAAVLQGQMIGSGANRILWRSEEIRVRNPVSCRCNEPGDFPCIDAATRDAVREAASSLVRDLLEPAPGDGSGQNR